jgi:hypothetical protein
MLAQWQTKIISQWTGIFKGKRTSPDLTTAFTSQTFRTTPMITLIIRTSQSNVMNINPAQLKRKNQMLVMTATNL